MLQPFYSTLRRQKGIVGELRPLSDDPASFESGSDLLTLNGRPRSRSHFTLSQKKLILWMKNWGTRKNDLLRTIRTRTQFYRLYLMESPKSDFLYVIKWHLSSTVIAFNGTITEKDIEFIGAFSEDRLRIRPYSAYYTGAYPNYHLRVPINTTHRLTTFVNR